MGRPSELFGEAVTGTGRLTEQFGESGHHAPGRDGQKRRGDVGRGVTELGEDLIGVLAERGDRTGTLDLAVDVDGLATARNVVAVGGVISMNAPDAMPAGPRATTRR